MSDGSLPPLFGATPTKVVFDGAGYGSPEARALFMSLQGYIRAFQASARQQLMMNNQTGTRLFQPIPNGQMEYSFNYGQETIRVRLEAAERERLVREQEVEVPPEYVPMLLAIDVIFAPSYYQYLRYIGHTFPVGGSSTLHAYARLTRRRWDILTAVGVTTSDISDDPKQAVSLQQFGGSSGDKFLAPTSRPFLIDDKAIPQKAITRRVTMEQNAGEEFFGGCFIARAAPEDDFQGPITFDLYMASMNTRAEWYEPVPNPGWLNDFPPGVIPSGAVDFSAEQSYRIRVREVRPSEARIVACTLEAVEFKDDLRTGFESISNSIVRETALSAAQLEAVPEEGWFWSGDWDEYASRLQTWHFLATREWEDDPDDYSPASGAVGMGELLAGTGQTTRNVAGPQNADIQYLEPDWAGPAPDGMTKIATVTWTPTGTEEYGSATISPT